MAHDLNALAIFAVVAEEKNFRAAADRMGVTRAAVSQTIRKLEEGLGIALVSRTTRSVALTEAGEQLYADASPALANIRTAIEAAGSLRGSPRGQLRLAVSSIAESFLSGPLLARFAEAARQEFGRVDVIVNNAGIMPLSPMASMKVEEWDRMVDVNIKGVLHGIAAVLPEMTARGSGHIINIASIGALRVVPTAAVYCATKYAVRAISDGLRQERDDIRVTCIHPGVVESELADTISDPVTAEAMKAYRAIALQPDAIGRAVRFAIEQPADVDINEIVVRPTRSAN